MSTLILGGAGYIGSHMVDLMIKENRDVVVVDNLLTGHQESLPKDVTFYKADIRDKQAMREIFKKENIEQVVHFAASSLVGESMENPLKYFDNNTGGMISLLEIMIEFDVKQIVFSSTAAIYGIPKNELINENDIKEPINPYGESKLQMEKIMNWSDKANGLKWVSLRYFNVAGAKEDGTIGEDHPTETHLLPIVLQTALGKRDEITMFGNDYNTRDGFNVRDYIHVLDLVKAHVLALDYLKEGNESNQFNLGSSTGYSVKEIVDVAKKVTGKNINAKIGPRRLGDPDSLVAESKKAKSILHWEPKYDDINKIIETAWMWYQKNPNGYKK